MFSLPLFLTVYAGFTHAFEADHLLAVSNIVTRRNNIRRCLKDGIFWGLGHASTILFIGLIFLIFKTAVPENYYHYFESIVGGMLIILGTSRLVNYIMAGRILAHSHEIVYANTMQLHTRAGDTSTGHRTHKLAYGIGVLHGLAGSGAIVLLAMSQTYAPDEGILYIVVFGAGCILGMMLAAALFTIPFSKRIMKAKYLQEFLILISSSLCILYGSKMIVENIFQ